MQIIHKMGLALSIAAAMVAFALARWIRTGRDDRWPIELAIAIGAALLATLLATALDFGGWNEIDWRAATFALLIAFAAVATVRLMRVWRLVS